MTSVYFDSSSSMRTFEERIGIPSGMVRVISCHHFTSQDVFLCENEPVSMGIAQEKLLVATVQHCIEVRDLSQRGHILHSFPTVDQVKQLVYSDVGNYVATLERKSVRKASSPITYIRAYLNWWVDMKGQPMRVRIAGCVTPSSQSGGSQLEMIELPLEEKALCIACCKRAATLAVSLGKTISVFCFNVKTHDISKQKFHDFDHIMDVNLSFLAHEIALCEDYFACLSCSQVHVFRVTFEIESDSSTVQDTDDSNNIQSKKQSVIVDNASDFDEDDCIEWRFEPCTENAAADTEYERQLREKLHPNSFPITIHLKSIDKANENDISSNPREIRGPTFNVPGCNLQVQLNSKIEDVWQNQLVTKVNAVTVLYRQFVFSGEHGGLQGLHLLPFYLTEKDCHEEDPLSAAASISHEGLQFSSWSPLCSTSHLQLKCLGCFFSAPQEGFLYDVTGKTELVCQYPYTATVKSVALEQELLHVLTETGLETYTLRLTHCAIRHTEKVDDLTNACPNKEEAICLLGLRPFLGVEQLLMSPHHLVLVSTMDDSISSTESIEGSSCTLYSLSKPSPQQLFLDLLETGQFHRSSSPPTYLHLLSEGHVILRTYLSQKNKQYCDSEVMQLYKKSCILMADHFLSCDVQQDRHLAVPYYLMSEIPVENVVQRVLEMNSQVKTCSYMTKLLVKYLDCKLFQGHCKEVNTISQTVAETILDLYAEELPEHLWKVILLSGVTSYKIEKAILLLKRRITSKKHPLTSAADTVAIVSLLLRKGNVETAQNMFLSLAKGDLVPVLIEVNSLLWDQGTLSLSPFGQLTKLTRPDAFIEVLLCLIDKNYLSAQETTLLFQNDAPGCEPHTTPLLKEFLETLLSDKKYSHYADNTSIVLLIKIYLNRIHESSNIPGCSLKGSTSGSGISRSAALFGNRYSWLNEAPPFNGCGVTRSCKLFTNSNSANKETKNEQDNPSHWYCPCWNCNEDLLRFQSLLCSSLISSEILSIVQQLMTLLKSKSRGYLSLIVLSSEVPKAVTLLMDTFPSVLFTYALDTFESNTDKWCFLFTLLDQKLQEISRDHKNYDTYFQAYQGILSHLAEILHPTAFLNLLPKRDKNVFLPHVIRCREKYQANQLRNKIVSLGMEIKAMM